jgi:superoxide oxidase
MNTSLLVPETNWRNSKDRYGSISVALHWTMFLLLVAVYSSIELREFYPKGSELRETFKTWHYMLGIAVLAFVFLRLAVMFVGAFPRVRPALTLWQGRFSKTMHLALYLFMIVAPVVGWLTLSSQGTPVPFFGLYLPALLAEEAATAAWTKTLHQAVGKLGYFLIAIHTAWALYQHYFFRSNALVNMLPKRD